MAYHNAIYPTSSQSPSLNMSPKDQSSTPIAITQSNAVKPLRWYVIRTSYGRVTKACAILDSCSIRRYMPLHRVVKVVKGKRKSIMEPLLPSIVFVYTDPTTIDTFMRRPDVRTFMTYYYNHFEVSSNGLNPPLVVPDSSMDNFIRATSVDNEHIMVVSPQLCHFKSGDIVRIIEGEFEGVEGRVARAAGQQRVIVELKGVCLVATAYIPTAFLKPITN